MVVPLAAISRAPRGMATFPHCPTAEIVAPWITITASEISSNGVSARSAWMAMGSIEAGLSYSKDRGIWDKTEAKALPRGSGFLPVLTHQQHRLVRWVRVAPTPGTAMAPSAPELQNCPQIKGFRACACGKPPGWASNL